MNNCSFIGRIGKDAVVRSTQAGKAVAGWSLAVDTGFGDKKTTMWVDCSLWGERAHKLAEYIRKGDRIGVVGELGTREHEGNTYVTLNVRDVTLLGESAIVNNRRGQHQEPHRRPVPTDDEFADDIPF